MNNTNFNKNQTTDTATDAQASEQPDPSSSSNKCRLLLAEIAELTRSGEDPARLRALQSEYDSQRLQFINQILKSQEQDLLLQLRAEQQTCLEDAEWICQALERPDLTLPEVRRLADLHQHYTHKILDSLLKEKELIEQKRRPGAHAKRH